ncbi:MAG: hypothetical protein CL424_17735 [Acidimicrobiaceae bacterium]|nr:hypothetical protein [Acidimicrobiaceae bacterium]
MRDEQSPTTSRIGRRSGVGRIRRPEVFAPPAPTETPQPPPERLMSTTDVREPVVITHEQVVDGADAELLWEAYHANFEPLAELAILQHLYTRDEVLAELANPRILKIVGRQGGRPVGMGMVTNCLDDVPQISPAFLRAKYPDHAQRDAIYFGILVMVSPEHRGRTLFSRLYTEMWQVPARAGGVLAFDICDFNRMAFDTDSLTRRIADQFPEATVDVIDRQTWYVAELPKPIPDTATRR